MTEDAAAPPPHSQTLSRGIRVLEVLAESDGPLSIAALAEALRVHRSIVYRILRTLEDHGLVARDAAGAVALAPRLAVLAHGVERDLQSAALPEITAAANDLAMTSFLVVLDDAECVTLLSAEPRASTAALAQRPGTRHSLAVGAPGLAIQALLSDAELAAHGVSDRRVDDGAVAARGFASSHDEVVRGLRSVAVPLSLNSGTPASIAVVYVASARSEAEIGARLARAAEAVRAATA